MSSESGSIVSSWKWAEVGQHSIVVSVGGDNIPGSPFVAVVHPGSAHLQYTNVVGESSSCVAGQPVTVRLVTRDKQGHCCDRGGQEIYVTVDGRPAKVSDLGDGSYKATFTPTKRGALFLAVSFTGSTGESRLMSNLKVAAGRAVAKESRIFCDLSQRSSEAGKAIRMEVVRADAFGNVISSSEGQPALQLSVDGPSKPIIDLVDAGDGKTYVHITSTVAGSYTASASFSDCEELIGTPLEFEVRLFSDLKLCINLFKVFSGWSDNLFWLQVLPLNPCPEHTWTEMIDSQIMPGKDVCICVEPRDCFGNLVRSCEHQVSLTGC
jgi:hypothetical protein